MPLLHRRTQHVAGGRLAAGASDDGDAHGSASLRGWVARSGWPSTARRRGSPACGTPVRKAAGNVTRRSKGGVSVDSRGAGTRAPPGPVDHRTFRTKKRDIGGDILGPRNRTANDADAVSRTVCRLGATPPLRPGGARDDARTSRFRAEWRSRDGHDRSCPGRGCVQSSGQGGIRRCPRRPTPKRAVPPKRP